MNILYDVVLVAIGVCSTELLDQLCVKINSSNNTWRSGNVILISLLNFSGVAKNLLLF